MAYVATVSSPMVAAERISRSLGVFAGTVNISSYATTLVIITGITKMFKTGSQAGYLKGIISVAPSGISSNKYELAWDYTTGAFKCYKPTSVSLAVDSNVAGGAALLFASGGGAAALHATSAVGNITYSTVATEAAANDDVGTCGFIAVGFV